ncbi:MAG: PAS domain S-box protein [Desulfobacterales bacterium]
MAPDIEKGGCIAAVRNRVKSLLKAYRSDVDELTDELQRTLLALRTAPDAGRHAFDASGIGCFDLDANGVVVAVNPAGAALFATERGRLIDKEFSHCITPEGRHHFARLRQQVLAGDHPQGGEVTVRRPDGSLLQACVRITAAAQAHHVQVAVKAVGESKRIETDLLECAEISDFLMTHSPNPILIGRADTTIRYVNPAFEKLTGFGAAELIGTGAPYPWWRPETTTETLAALKVAMTTGIRRVEERFQKKSGDRFWVELTAGLVDHGHGPPYYLASWVDITDRKKAADELRESEQRYRSLVDNTALGVTLIDSDLKIRAMNRQMREWYPHIDPTEFPLCYHVYCDPPRQRRCAPCPAFESLRDGRVHETTRRTPIGGELRFHRVVSSPIKSQDGQVVAAIEMIEDVTDRRHTEERIKNLSRRLLNAQEDERRMISRELHDSVAQELSIVKMALANLLDPQSSAAPEALQKMSHLNQMLDRSIQAVRNLAYGLRPPGLEEIGLLQTLATLCEEFTEGAGIDVDFQTAGFKDVALDPFVEINLYRLVQEGLNNIRKHAAADRVVIKLVGSHPNVILRIIDNGRGFDVQAREQALDNEKRMGLRSMKERVMLLQGRMEVRSRPGKGTSIHIRFPHQEKNDESKKKRPHRR